MYRDISDVPVIFGILLCVSGSNQMISDMYEQAILWEEGG
jgi:hypothetical protein